MAAQRASEAWVEVIGVALGGGLTPIQAALADKSASFAILPPSRGKKRKIKRFLLPSKPGP